MVCGGIRGWIPLVYRVFVRCRPIRIHPSESDATNRAAYDARDDERRQQMTDPQLDVRTITTAQTTATQVVGPDDGPTLIINLDSANTIYLHNGDSFTTTDQSGVFPLAPNQGMVIDPSSAPGLSLYALTVPGAPANLGIVPGGVHFFLPTSKLTIPTGATTGERIVIDGTNGTITMYNASNQVTGLWSADDQSIRIGTATSYIKLIKPAANVSEILFNPDTANYSDGSISATVSSLTNIADIQMISPVSNQAGAQAANFSISSSQPAALNPNSIPTAGNTGDLTTSGFLHEGGAATGPQSGNVTLGAAPSGDITLATCQITADGFSTYKVTASWDGVTTGGTQTNNHYIFRIMRGASIVWSSRQGATPNNTTQCGGSMVMPDTPPAGTQTYKLTANHDVGTDSSVAVTPAMIMVEGFQ